MEVLSQVLKEITGIKLTKKGNYSTNGDLSALRCSHKAHDGYLYPLHKAFIFIYNPIAMIPYESIAKVHFERLDVNSTVVRTFDMVLFMKPGKQTTEKQFIFHSINKDEFQNLMKLLLSHRIDLRGIPEEATATVTEIGEGEEESEDEDFNSVEEEADDLEFEEETEPIDMSALEAMSGDEEDMGDLIGSGSEDEKPKPKPKKRRRSAVVDLSEIENVPAKKVKKQ